LLAPARVALLGDHEPSSALARRRRQGAARLLLADGWRLDASAPDVVIAEPASAASARGRWPGAALVIDLGDTPAASVDGLDAVDGVMTLRTDMASVLRRALGGAVPVDAVPLGEERAVSPVPADRRRGVVLQFDPSSSGADESLTFLCLEVVPQIDAGLRRAHPVTVVAGSPVDRRLERVAGSVPGLRLLGGLPDVRPYVDHARVVVVLQAAALDLVDALMAATPVVATSIASAGLGLDDVVLPVDGAAEVAGELSALLASDRLWQTRSTAGREAGVSERGDAAASVRLMTVIDRARERRAVEGRTGWSRVHHVAARHLAALIESAGGPDRTLVVGDLDAGARARRLVDHHPADGLDALDRLLVGAAGGARRLAVPATERWWLVRYPELADHLRDHATVLAASEAGTVFGLREPPPPGPPKVFGIGLNKTATTSLHHAVEILGLRGLHWGGERAYLDVMRAGREGRRLLHFVGEEFDAYTDIETLAKRFDLADLQYPGSKFVLTVRDIDEWVDSRRRHAERNRNGRRGTYTGTNTVIDEPAWRDEWHRHRARVETWFTDRPGDLLVLDICAGEGWERLAPFLGHAVPDVPFPRENIDREVVPA
jgi:Sulfotransferase domain/Glycosyl transferases group 1